MRTNELILYRHMGQENILRDMSFLMENFESGFYNPEDMRGLLFEAVSNLMELSASHGFEGNLWHTYLTYLLVSDENAYSTACEIVGPAEGSINRVAEHDCLTMIFSRCRSGCRQNAWTSFSGIRITGPAERCSTRGSETGFVNWRGVWSRRRMSKRLKRS